MVFRLKTAFSFSVCSFVTLSAPVREHSWCLRLRPGSWWNAVWQMVPLSTLPASLGRSVVCGTGPSLSSPFHEWKLAWKSLFTVSPMCVCVCVCTAGKLWPGKLQCIQGRCYVYDSNVCQGVGKVRAGWFHLLLTSLSLSLSLCFPLFFTSPVFPCYLFLFHSTLPFFYSDTVFAAMRSYQGLSAPRWLMLYQNQSANRLDAVKLSSEWHCSFDIRFDEPLCMNDRGISTHIKISRTVAHSWKYLGGRTQVPSATWRGVDEEALHGIYTYAHLPTGLWRAYLAAIFPEALCFAAEHAWNKL